MFFFSTFKVRLKYEMSVVEAFMYVLVLGHFSIKGILGYVSVKIKIYLIGNLFA